MSQPKIAPTTPGTTSEKIEQGKRDQLARLIAQTGSEEEGRRLYDLINEKIRRSGQTPRPIGIR